jgi:uncharacterized protein (UPF0332 family)
MAFAEDLLEQAQHLARREKTKPRQASLRRAVSTAYYALFHLLIQEAVLNWKRTDQGPLFARFFEHGRMRNASEKQRAECRGLLARRPVLPAAQVASLRHLHHVSHTFVEAQQRRHSADYDNSKKWTRTEVSIQIDAIQQAFARWKAIRDQSVAQDYLLSLLGNPRG